MGVRNPRSVSSSLSAMSVGRLLDRSPDSPWTTDPRGHDFLSIVSVWRWSKRIPTAGSDSWPNLLGVQDWIESGTFDNAPSNRHLGRDVRAAGYLVLNLEYFDQRQPAVFVHENHGVPHVGNHTAADRQVPGEV